MSIGIFIEIAPPGTPDFLERFGMKISMGLPPRANGNMDIVWWVKIWWRMREVFFGYMCFEKVVV
jgi:hypothetical protein